ncbi:hypothetical protein ABPG74_015292 [Tetrahymena malaccensis]
MTKDSTLRQEVKEGGQATIVFPKGKKSISKVFKNMKTFQRENDIQLKIIQPLNKIFLNKPFAIAYPQKSTKDLSKKEFKMKKYDGDMQAYLNSNPILNEDEVRMIFVKFIYPVYILHRCKIYHGDLKPENYLYKICKKTKELQIYLTDFGGAELVSSRNVLIHTPYCYSSKFHPINLLDPSHPHFNPFYADCSMLGVILQMMSEHLKEPSSDLKILINDLVNKKLMIEELILFRWINCSKNARNLILKLSMENHSNDLKDNRLQQNELNRNYCSDNQQSQLCSQNQIPIMQRVYYQPIQYQYQYYNPYQYPYDFRYVQFIQNHVQPYPANNNFLFNNELYTSKQQTLSLSQ